MQAFGALPSCSGSHGPFVRPADGLWMKQASQGGPRFGMTRAGAVTRAGAGGADKPGQQSRRAPLGDITNAHASNAALKTSKQVRDRPLRPLPGLWCPGSAPSRGLSSLNEPHRSSGTAPCRILA
jgi:hypothetical protein